MVSTFGLGAAYIAYHGPQFCVLICVARFFFDCDDCVWWGAAYQFTRQRPLIVAPQDDRLGHHAIPSADR